MLDAGDHLLQRRRGIHVAAAQLCRQLHPERVRCGLDQGRPDLHLADLAALDFGLELAGLDRGNLNDRLWHVREPRNVQPARL
jgi:hypothetical protein